MNFWLFSYLASSSIPFPEDCEIFETAVKNSSRYQPYSCVMVMDVDFKGFSDEFGGAICYIGHRADQLFICYCSFTYCSAQGSLYSSGGAVFESAKNFTTICTSYYGCNAVNKGQAILASAGSTTYSTAYLNQSTINKCAIFDEYEFPYYSLYLSRTNVEAYGFNSSNNRVTEYGASFGLLDIGKISFSYSAISDNEGRNIMHLTSSDDEVKVIKNCLILRNIPRDPSVVMFYGNWGFVKCFIYHKYGKFYSFDWSKEGNLLFENCEVSGFKLIPSLSVNVYNTTYDDRIPATLNLFNTCSSLGILL